MYPIFKVTKRFLNSGTYIGYVKDIYAIISYIVEKHAIRSSEDDQKYFHYIYLNRLLRKRHKIKLDYNSEIFFNVYGSAEEAEFHCQDGSLR